MQIVIIISTSKYFGVPYPAYRPIQIIRRSEQKRLVKNRSTAPGRDSITQGIF
jgi:hypothetical protein